MKRPRFPKVDSKYTALGGGLDLLTPAITMPPGKAISSQNYEPVIGGGYGRIKGNERFDGRPLPSSSRYWIADVALTGALAVGNVITGLTSGATATVLYIIPATPSTAIPAGVPSLTSMMAPWMGGASVTGRTLIVLGNLIGTYTVNESISNGVTIGTIGDVSVESAASASDNADYANLAADLQRLNIGPVPGSGPIRGIKMYRNVWYAFRDNLAATAGDMYKATVGGWVKVNFGSQIQFTAAVGQIFPYSGTVITGLTSGATARVVTPMLRTGSWTVAGAGTLIVSNITGTWQSGEAIQVSGVTKATSASVATAIARLPGGMVEMVNANFTGSTDTKRMYGADGVNLAFEFDGTNYIPIRTGMVADTPKHIVFYKNYLSLSFRGSVQFSGIGNPYAWTAILGAGEIATGEPVTGFAVQSGSNAGASLAIFSEDGQTFILYGSSLATFQLQPSVSDIGAFAYTAQGIGNDTMMLTRRGIQRLKTTLNYGDFEYASVSHLVQPLLTAKRGLQTASTSLKTKNQYRVYFSDGTALAVGLTGDKISGIMPLDYGIPVRCICTDEDETGAEVTMFGSDDGYVYRESSGTSFDGEPIVSALRLPFNHLGAPQVRKSFRSAVLELVCEGFSNLTVAYDLGYGSLDVAQGVANFDKPVQQSGGYWDQFIWDEFTWDEQAIGNPRISLDGVEKNISLLFYSSRDQDNAHTLQGYTVNYTPTRLEH